MKKTGLIAMVVAILIMPFVSTAERVGGGEVVYKSDRSDVAKVLYSHQKHVSEKGLKCTNCHYKLFAMGKGSKLTMNSISSGQSCGACHNGQAAFDAKDRNNCGKCHMRA